MTVIFYPNGSSLWSAKSECQSRSFFNFNHEGQLERRAVDEITPTQTTKSSLQRIATISLILLSLSLTFSVFSFPHCLAILHHHLPPEWNNACWCFPCIPQRKSWHEDLCNPTKANRNNVCS